ncbi:MAG: DinB family protein [Catenulispora sp.]|nr:DinB family protein [Catenulispora sp.]
MDKAALHAELDRVRADFHALLDGADPADLARPTDGTRWTNEQLLFHMLFGYLIVRTLLVLMRVGSRMPGPVGRGFARPLDAAARPFNAVNYWGSCIGARVVNHRRMGRRLDAVIASLHRRLDREDDSTLRRSMPYPARWDPYFADVMTRADLYRYGTQHYDHHRKQLTLAAAATATDAAVPEAGSAAD